MFSGTRPTELDTNSAGRELYWELVPVGEFEQLDMWASRLLLGTETDIASGSGRERSDELLLVRSRCKSDRDLIDFDREAEEIEIG